MSDERIRRGLSVARKESKRSDFPQHQLGCAILYGKETMGKGHNSSQTHPTQMKFNKLRKLNGSKIYHKLHAEIKAIESIKHYEIDWRKVELFIYREHRNGHPALSRPCPACMELIRKMGIRKIVYSNANPFGYTIENII